MQIISKAELERIESMVRVLEIVITIFKLLPIVIGILAGISLIFAALNFVEKNYAWAIVNLLLGVAGILFVVRVSRSNAPHFEQFPHAADQ
ncbi:hypothetical protein [Nitrososphaera viennensis]|uniref:Uncharacterized protein n=2 Tax=Nitrososphaera viennensis TaxID=1034015 RepID=A0A060HUP4_9ARCH|nr:hypothetical protein [Nitrososphaera viennensis]AIC17151.1 hypothetical protein NVIE_028760 [Nitrososphaera viennensis EN76]UVS69042.1 hypothetical protein NWT39_14190 [Nitrososphaera viennensis]